MLELEPALFKRWPVAKKLIQLAHTAQHWRTAPASWPSFLATGASCTNIALVKLQITFPLISKSIEVKPEWMIVNFILHIFFYTYKCRYKQKIFTGVVRFFAIKKPSRSNKSKKGRKKCMAWQLACLKCKMQMPAILLLHDKFRNLWVTSHSRNLWLPLLIKCNNCCWWHEEFT